MAAAVAQFETMAEIRSLAQEFPQAACAAKKKPKNPDLSFQGLSSLVTSEMSGWNT